VARQGARRQAGPAGHAGLPHEHHLPVLDIVLPTATWYEKNDLNTSDMHPFIHPLSTAVDPAWQSAATGRSTRALPRPSARSASATWASRRTWC
jgi:hypothetical protein